MPIKTSSLTVTTSPIQIKPNRMRTNISITNLGETRISIISNGNLAESEGYPIESGNSFLMGKVYGDNPTNSFYLISSSGSNSCRVLETLLYY